MCTRTRLQVSMAGRSPASVADLTTGLLPRPQFETELGGQRPVRSQQQWAEISSAQAGFNGQIHETSDLQDVEFFKGASGGHIAYPTDSRFAVGTQVCLKHTACCTQGIPQMCAPAECAFVRCAEHNRFCCGAPLRR